MQWKSTLYHHISCAKVGTWHIILQFINLAGMSSASHTEAHTIGHGLKSTGSGASLLSVWWPLQQPRTGCIYLDIRLKEIDARIV